MRFAPCWGWSRIPHAGLFGRRFGVRSRLRGGLPAPFADGRSLGSALYSMVTPSAPVQLHRIRNDQLYHYYLGDPLEVLLLHVDGTSERVIVGADLRRGQR